MVLIDTRNTANLPAAQRTGPQRWRRHFSEQYHTMRTLNAARRNGLVVSGFDLQRDRYIVLADVHRGEGDPVLDDFLHNEATYLHALRYYLDADFRLILNGDIEECWKSDMGRIIDRYADTAYAIEREFVNKGPGYYLRTYGNHDDNWMYEAAVRTHLHPILGHGVRVYSSIALGDQITIAHGHQGDLTSDRISAFSRWFVRDIWRPTQERFGVTQDLKSAKNNPIKTNRDRSLWGWAFQQHQLLIAGHTHRALFHPHTERQRHYVNVGACVHKDGLTGIEIDRGEMRLVRWETPTDTTPPRRTVVESSDLGLLLSRL